jgi:FkbM family methyltransferase
MILHRRLGSRLQSFGRALEQPGRLRRKLTGEHVDEEVMTLAARPYLRAASVRTVLDVGANHGQFARTALRAFPIAKIFCFEPLPSAHGALLALAAQSGDRIELEPVALGEENGQIEFNVTSFSPSSSALPLDTPIAALGSQIELASTTKVPVRTLADWAASKTLVSDIVIKLDVQGYEASVLRGAGDFLRQARVIVAETIFAPLYKGQASLGELCALLEPFRFRYREAFGVIRDPLSGEPLWQDSVFVRAEEEQKR